MCADDQIFFPCSLSAIYFNMWETTRIRCANALTYDVVLSRLTTVALEHAHQVLQDIDLPACTAR